MKNNPKLNTQHPKLFSGVYSGKRVLVTGHTGFKGSWLVYWLKSLGADVCGYALDAPTEPNHFDLLNVDMESIIGDIRNKEKLGHVFSSFKPEIVFHLAAQPLVRLSYDEPVETFETNIMGTINVFEVCRNALSVKAIVNITSDKCYDNKEWVWGYRERDPMGGFDPYSASKGCAELITNSYRNSFFNIDKYGKEHNILLASCRAGNVVGGGDWAKDRLIPDIMKAVSRGDTVCIRNLCSTRPWQHVLEPLSGYLHLGQKLLRGKREFAEGWNFGPGDVGQVTVGKVVEEIKKYWPKLTYKLGDAKGTLHEAGLLKLDCSKAHSQLKWREVWDAERVFEKTVAWYRCFYEEGEVNTQYDLNAYVEDAINKNITWIK